MLGELEYPDQPDDPEEGQSIAAALRPEAALREHDGDDGDEVRNDWHQVDDVLEVFDEVDLWRAGHRPDDHFEGEPSVANALDYEERIPACLVN